MAANSLIDPATKQFYPELIPAAPPVVPQGLGEVLQVNNSAATPVGAIPQSATDFDTIGALKVETGIVGQGNNLALVVGEAGDNLQIKGATLLGSLLVGNGVNTETLPVGTNGLVLKANSAQPLGVEWGTTLPFIPINRLINAPPTIRPIDDGAAGPAELTAGSFVFNVSDLYDPLVPYGTSVVLMCEIFYQATFDKPLFSPARPLSSNLTGVYVFNEDGTSGAPFSFAPTQITFVFDYLVNGLAASFTEKTTIGQSTLTRLCPQVAALIPLATPIAEGYNANVHLIGGIDCSTLNPADVITFRLLGFTSFAGHNFISVN
jgi:hypothetical protein